MGPLPDRALNCIPYDCSRHDGSVAIHAAMVAGCGQQSSEAAIDALTQQAVQLWRLDDATFWQRVKFQARLIRATQKIRVVDA